MAFVAVHYLEMNLLILAGYGVVKLIQTFPFRYKNLLIISRTLLLCALILPVMSGIFPKQSFLSPSAQIWHATSMRHYQEPTRADSIVTVGTRAHLRNIPVEALDGLTLLLLLSMISAFSLRFGGGALQLRRVLSKSYRLRRVGRAELRVSDDIAIPFSFWTPLSAYIVLPSHILQNAQELRIAVRHESQHHRHRDTRWSYACELFRCVFILNPFTHLFIKQHSEIQEFACDEALIERKNVSPHAYGSCLLRVAETARGTHAVTVGTTCMAVSPSGSFLKRRIHHMLNVKTKRYLKRSVTVWVGLMGVTVMATVAWASQGLIHDRRVSLAEATQLAESTRKNSNFPITVNEAVVKELNRYVGTPDGREFIKNALARMENYRPMIERKLDEYNLPKELMAMPIMESGYKNLPQSENPIRSAGVWQFVPETARNYGMQVTAKIDDRLNVEIETDAACRYLGALNFRFQNWELAVMSYNAGEHQVQRGINKTGSRNAWTLIEKGFTGDRGYLAKMMAAILIVNNPAIVE